MLLNWGFELAKTNGLGCYLQAAPLAHKLYRKRGFKDVASFDFETGLVEEGEVAADCGPYMRVLMHRICS
jgi:hypothetical protein